MSVWVWWPLVVEFRQMVLAFVVAPAPMVALAVVAAHNHQTVT